LHTEGFIFENNLGYPLTFYIQSIGGEKAPKASYQAFNLEPGKVTFLPRSEMRKLRRQQATAEYGKNLKIISEDTLRIIATANGWRYSPGIPIDLARCHSFLFKKTEIRSKTSFIEHRFPTVCRITSNVFFSNMTEKRNHIKL